MPKLKYRGRETLRQEEFDKMLEDCGNKKITKPERLRCILCITWMFGKRISEILKLKHEDLWFKDGRLFVRFDVGKKRRDDVVKKTYIKYTIESSKYVQKVIRPYIEGVAGGYLFPSYGKGENRRVIMPGARVYEYKTEGGHITSGRIRQQLKVINERVWPHLIRHSLATRMAEQGVGVPQLIAWFDWSHDSANVAMGYVEGTPQMIEELGNREW